MGIVRVFVILLRRSLSGVQYSPRKSWLFATNSASSDVR